MVEACEDSCFTAEKWFFGQWLFLLQQGLLAQSRHLTGEGQRLVCQRRKRGLRRLGIGGESIAVLQV
jgi:hypothetical protein